MRRTEKDDNSLIPMNRAISAVAVFASALASQAQISTALNRLPDGLNEVRIRNNASTSLTAFVVTVRQTPGSDSTSNAPFIVFSDSLIDPALPPLLASEERVVIDFVYHPGRRRSLLEEPVIAAGIFADGTTTGDALLLNRLLMRRSNMLLAVETALETVLRAGSRNVPRQQLVDEFDRLANSLQRWYVPAEQRVARGLYRSIAGKLRNLPTGEPGSPFPPDGFVQQETALLTRDRALLLASQPNLADATPIEQTALARRK
jgi:hypothetical protein